MFSKSISTKGGDVFRDEKSLAFDGSNDYLDCGNTNDLGTGDFTITAWVKAADFDNVYIVSKRKDNDNRYYLRTDQSNPPRLQFYSKISGSAKLEYLGGTSVNLDNLQNQWVHFAISADRDGNIVGYINGILDDTDSADTTDLDNTGDFYIGRFSSTYSDCSISEVAIYNSALTANQVKTIYNGREPYNHKEGVASGNLQAWYRMGDGSLDKNSFTSSFLICDETNATLGNNMVTNGTFDSDSDWTKGTGWSIGPGGAAASSIGANELSQDISAVTGKIYKVSMDLTSLSNGLIFLDISGSQAFQAAFFAPGASTGYYEAYVKATGSVLRIYSMSFGPINFTGSIDNVKVQLVNGNAAIMTNMGAEDIEGDTP